MPSNNHYNRYLTEGRTQPSRCERLIFEERQLCKLDNRAFLFFFPMGEIFGGHSGPGEAGAGQEGRGPPTRWEMSLVQATDLGPVTVTPVNLAR